MLLQPCDGMSFISIFKAYVTCLIKSSCCSCMKIEKKIPYLFFFFEFEMYKTMKFHFRRHTMPCKTGDWA